MPNMNCMYDIPKKSMTCTLYVNNLYIYNLSPFQSYNTNISKKLNIQHIKFVTS